MGPIMVKYGSSDIRRQSIVSKSPPVPVLWRRLAVAVSRSFCSWASEAGVEEATSVQKMLDQNADLEVLLTVTAAPTVHRTHCLYPPPVNI